MKKVRKAVFPVAGLGTRILPATKAMPKEMLTIVDKPLIQYAVEEAREAGIEQFIFVTGRGKGALEDHFDIGYELEAVMSARGKSLAPLDGTRFTPGAIARQVPALRALLEAREQLANLQRYMDGKVAAEDQLKKLLADPQLMQALKERREAAIAANPPGEADENA